MIKLPIHPVVFNGVVDLMMRDFTCDIDQAIRITEKLILSLRSKDLDITRGNWMLGPSIVDEPRTAGRGKATWDRMTEAGEEWENSLGGKRPWVEVQ